jgi:hypothetical protein
MRGCPLHLPKGNFVKIHPTTIAMGSALLSFLFFAFQKEWVILQKPAHINHVQVPHTEQKECTLFWNTTLLQQENKKIIWTDDIAQNLHYVMNSWLTFLYDEELHKKVHVETAMLNNSQTELFISFDRYPFGKQQSIDEKLFFIKNFTQTIAQCTNITKIRFLVRHKPLQDPHLDFGQSWEI